MLTVQTTTLNRECLLDRPDVLAVVDFDANPGERPTDARHIVTPLAADTPYREVWTSPSGPVTTGPSGAIHYARTDSETIGSLILEDQGEDIETLAHRAYAELLAWLANRTTNVSGAYGISSPTLTTARAMTNAIGVSAWAATAHCGNLPFRNRRCPRQPPSAARPHRYF